jgi:hypothetical protein
LVGSSKNHDLSPNAVADKRSRRNTDYVLVPKAKAEQAVEILRIDGWYFTSVS